MILNTSFSRFLCKSGKNAFGAEIEQKSSHLRIMVIYKLMGDQRPIIDTQITWVVVSTMNCRGVL